MYDFLNHASGIEHAVVIATQHSPLSLCTYLHEPLFVERPHVLHVSVHRQDCLYMTEAMRPSLHIRPCYSILARYLD